ncbi:MAG: hypothetical protein WBC86_23380, partial [Pseudolabrys sp.]
EYTKRWGFRDEMHGGSAGTIIPKCSFLLGLAVYTFSLSQPGHGESDANACRGVDFDTKRRLSLRAAAP